MKRMTFGFLIVGCMFLIFWAGLSPVIGDGQGVARKVLKDVNVEVVADALVDSNVVRRIAYHLACSFNVAVRISSTDDRDFGVVIRPTIILLGEPSKWCNGQPRVFGSNEVARVFVEAFEVSKPWKHLTAEERFARRLEKECVRTLGLMIGLESCPNPTCAMSACNTEQDLDSKGRDLAPPCATKVRGLLSQKGLEYVVGGHVIDMRAK